MDDVASEIEFLRDNANNSNRMDGEVDSPTELESITLYEGKKFSTWEICESFLDVWAKKQDFRIIKDRVLREDSFVYKRAFICDHGRTYESNSNKDTSSKRTHCPFLVNTSCPKNKNPDTSVFVNKIVDKHNYELNKDRIEFEESKKFTSEMMDDIKFMTISCKFGGMIATSRVESVNVCLKHLLHNSNISLCDLAAKIYRLLDLQNKEYEYKFWQLSIPTTRNQNK
ncbi:10644_t:CDS:2, partial [Funneliformis caledonium]